MPDRDDKVLFILGELRSDVSNSNDRLERMENGQEKLRLAVEKQGRTIAKMSVTCAIRGRTISSLNETANQVQQHLRDQTAVRRWLKAACKTAWSTKVFWLPLLAAMFAVLGWVAAK